MASRQILVNTCIPKKTKKGKFEWYEHDLTTYFDDFLYEQYASNTDAYFKRARVINFGIMNHEC